MRKEVENKRLDSRIHFCHLENCTKASTLVIHLPYLNRLCKKNSLMFKKLITSILI